jgi:MFS family permease
MIAEETHDPKIHKRLTPCLRAANADGMSWAGMVGFGETYLNVFGIFLKATSVQLGLLATLPQFLGAISQMFGVWAMSFFSSRRSTIITVVRLNAIVWIFIALLPFLFGTRSSTVWFLLFFSSLYFITGNFSTPSWNSLIGDMVPSHIRGRYFGYRNRLIGLSTFVSILVAGQILDFSKRYLDSRFGFLFIFLAAFAARAISIRFLRKYDDPPYHVRHEHHFSFWQFIRRSPRSNFARFVYFVSVINFGVNIATPFFAVYMLRDLHLSYLEYTIVTATNTITQFLTMQYWGRLSDQFGNKKILNICGYGVALSPLTWMFGSSLSYLLLIQVYAGFVWAGFNLAVANFLFDAVSPPKRARCVAYQAMVNGAFVLIGSLLGGYLSDHLPGTITLFGASWTPLSPLIFVFVISGVLRLIASLLLLPMFSEVRTVEQIKHHELIFRITNIASIAEVTFSILPNGKRKRGHRENRPATAVRKDLEEGDRSGES